MREIKLGFTRYYNKRYGRRGYFWGDRFKSVVVENGQTLINCLAYIDLNPIRAGLVSRPEDYRWNSIGYHVQTSNKGRFLSLDFGLKSLACREIKGDCVTTSNSRYRVGRQFVHWHKRDFVSVTKEIRSPSPRLDGLESKILVLALRNFKRRAIASARRKVKAAGEGWN